MPPMPYTFGWAVKDAPSSNDFAHEETADDKGLVTGSYRVLLPDGRTQIVKFQADGKTGFVADVKYEGEAKFPEPKPAAANAKPTYAAKEPEQAKYEEPAPAASAEAPASAAAYAAPAPVEATASAAAYAAPAPVSKAAPVTEAAYSAPAPAEAPAAAYPAPTSSSSYHRCSCIPCSYQ